MKAKEILKLLENCDLDKLTQENCKSKVIRGLPKDFKFQWDNGVSKLVILPRDEKYVIKIPFSGYEDEDGYADNFYANDDDNHNWDYCFTETLLYRGAVSYGCQDFFCKTKMIGCVNNYPIYVQQRATILGSKLEFTKIEKIRKSERYCQKTGFPKFNSTWIADAIDYYSEKDMNNLMSFIREAGIASDLHASNIGYIGKKPVLVDYSDYRE